MTVPDTLIDYASSYFTVCAVGFLFQFLYNGIAALLRSVGDSQASLYFLTISSLCNIALNYAFIAWKWMLQELHGQRSFLSCLPV